jgi:nitrite reductase/ring-hydroxylating ferredoxin subunit
MKRIRLTISRLLKRFTFSGVLLSLFFFSACAPDVSDDAIPYVQFSDIIINLNLPAYIALKYDGGYQRISGGVRGIIIYRKNSSTYIAYERNSSYHPNEACATVDVHSSGLYMIDTCSNSTFDFSTGKPTSGPAIRPLRQYVVLLNNSELTISSDIAN